MRHPAEDKSDINGCWVNGMPVDSVSALDRGLHYGDGVFEIIAVKDGGIPLLNFHLERLMDGCRKLHIPVPAVAELKDELRQAAMERPHAVLKLVVTRGVGARTYRPPHPARQVRILLRFAWPEYPAVWVERGVHVRICDTHLGHNSRLAGLKHLNRLEQVLAQSEWTETDDIQEGLMTDGEGSVISGTATNVFAWLSHGVLATPSLRLCGVAGIMRRYLLERAQQTGMQLRVATLSLAELMKAQEIFLTNTLIGVWPVATIGHWRYTAGPVTRQMQAWAAECAALEKHHG